jgi:hypothetical protein
MPKAAISLMQAERTPRRVKYINNIDAIEGISPEDREMLRQVSQRYVFRANDYYLTLIDWKDPADPIRQLIIPRKEELNDWGKLDASNEASVTVEPGVQHKYQDTALLLSPDISANVPKYIKGKVTELVGSSHDNIVVAMTDYDPSVLCVYKWLDIGRDRAQSSWSSWTFTGAFVRGASWIESTLYLVIERPQGLFLEKMTVEPNRADPQSKFVAALDRRTVPTSKTYNATTNQTTLNLPYNVHNSARMRAVTQAVEQSQDYDFGANWSQPALDLDGNSANIDLNFLVSTREGGYLFRVVSASGSTMVISGNAMDRPVWVGETYDFRYRFSIPYLRQDQERTGTSITTGRLQLRNMSVRYANSAYFKATVTQRFGGGSYESLYTGNLLGTGQSIIHGITIDSGSFRIPILARNDEAVIELTSDSHLPCAFVGAEIEATYDARTQRV